MSNITLTLPKPHAGQIKVKNEARRFNIVDSGRRWGKTLFGESVLIEPALRGYPVGWFSPRYKMLSEVWRDVRTILKPVVSRVNTQQQRLELVTGGVVEMWSLDQPDTARGRRYKTVIIDEAAMVKNLQDAWQQVIRPTLTDFEGDAWFLSTPKGLNYFWNLYNLGQDELYEDYKSWKFPTLSNPFISPKEIEAAKRELPERVFAQEYLAEFLGDGTGVFRKVVDAATAIPQDPIEGHDYVIGCDWGKLNDFSVFIVLDSSTMEMVAWKRFNQIDYTVQFDHLRELYNKYKPSQVVAERNTLGEFPLETFRREGMRIVPFVTSQSSKATIITALELAFDRGNIKIFNDPVLVGELLAFDAERLPGGALRYSAPENQHDDCVMSLALAYHAARGKGVIETLPPEVMKALQDYMGF